MVLSVVIYNHSLTLGQWGGAAVVFAGISVEAWVKRKGTMIFVHQYFEIWRLNVLHRGSCETGDCREGEGQDQVIVTYTDRHSLFNLSVEDISITCAICYRRSLWTYFLKCHAGLRMWREQLLL